VQAFDLFDPLDTKNAKKGRIRKNSLLNSLFSGNLRDQGRCFLHRARPLEMIRILETRTRAAASGTRLRHGAMPATRDMRGIADHGLGLSNPFAASTA
jgi:hypothetical protein